jgi:hypothetical protein
MTDRQDELPTTYSLDSLSDDLTNTSSSFSSDRRGMLSLFSGTHCTLLIQKPPTKLTTHNNKTEARRRRRRGIPQEIKQSLVGGFCLLLVYFCTLGFGMAVKP